MVSPPSRPQRGLNEVLLSDACAYLSGLRCPAIVAGDLNDSLQTSPKLAMCTAIGVHDKTPNLPTTMQKDGHVAKSPPIDHEIVNGPRSGFVCEDQLSAAHVRSLSDHL